MNINAGKVQVVINGFQPLFFETNVEFRSGEEIAISLRYDRIFGFCRRCFSLCHDDMDCPQVDGGGNGNDGPPGDKDLGFKGAVDHRNHKSKEGENKAPKVRDDYDNRKYQRAHRSYKHCDDRRYAGEGSQVRRYNEPQNGMEQRYVITTTENAPEKQDIAEASQTVMIQNASILVAQKRPTQKSLSGLVEEKAKFGVVDTIMHEGSIPVLGKK